MPLITHPTQDLLQLPLELVLLTANVRHDIVQDVKAQDTGVACAGDEGGYVVGYVCVRVGGGRGVGTRGEGMGDGGCWQGQTTDMIM